MMARNTNVPFKGRIQKRKTHVLQIITFGLQRAAGPYRWATLRHLMRPLPTFDGRRLSEDQQPQDINSLLTTRYIHNGVYI